MILFKRKITRLSRQQLWMLLSFALYTENEELVKVIRDEVQQREVMGIR